MSKILRIGQLLYGYCSGHFGRDSYEDKRIEAVGIDWVVARELNGKIVFAIIKEDQDLLYYTKEPEDRDD